MLDILCAYVKNKRSINDPEYFAKYRTFLEGKSIFWQKVPKQLLKIVDGIEIWITVSLICILVLIELVPKFILFKSKKKKK